MATIPFLAGETLESYSILYPAEEIYPYYRASGAATPENTEYHNPYRKAAERLYQKIMDTFGISLKLVDDSTRLGKYEILVGPTNRDPELVSPTTYQIEAVVGKVYLRTGGALSITAAVDKLFDLLCAGEALLSTPVKDNIFWQDAFPLAEGASLRVMSVNILAEFTTWCSHSPVVLRKECIKGYLDIYQPDVVGIQEYSPAWQKIFREEILPAGAYALVHDGVVNNYLSIVYRTDRLRLVDEGFEEYRLNNNDRARRITWAVLEEIEAPNRRFAFLSTHWDGCEQRSPVANRNTRFQVFQCAALVRRLHDKYHCPVFITGDFNSNEWSRACIDFEGAANVRDAKYDAVTRINNIGSWHGLALWETFDADEAKHSAGSCDHIYHTPDAIPVTFETLWKAGQLFASDHAWLGADFALPNP
jgi:endonuclease/exonuclease/phosphatase family metal-dependent hydrolase